MLFVSAGRRVELIRAFDAALRGLGLAGTTVAVDMDPLAPALQVSQRSYVVPSLESPEFVPEIVDICRREEIRLVFPLIDPDIPVLAANRAAIEATGARLAVVGGAAAAVAADKWSSHLFLRGLGLPTPETWPGDSVEVESLDYPVFVKPRYGSASKLSFRVDEPAVLGALLRYVPDPVVQEFLSGPELTSDVICDVDGELLAVVTRRRLAVRAGEVAKGVTVFDRAVADGCAAIAAALPASGPITVQCFMRDATPVFTEVNARLGGGAPLAIAAGADFPRWLLARAAGLPVDIPEIGRYRVGLYLSRFDDSFFLDEGAREQMARSRIRPG